MDLAEDPPPRSRCRSSLRRAWKESLCTRRKSLALRTESRSRWMRWRKNSSSAPPPPPAAPEWSAKG